MIYEIMTQVGRGTRCWLNQWLKSETNDRLSQALHGSVSTSIESTSSQNTSPPETARSLATSAEVPDVQPGAIRAPGKTLTLPLFNGTSASGALDRHDDRRGTTRALDLPPGASDVPRKVMRAAKHHIQRAIEMADEQAMSAATPLLTSAMPLLRSTSIGVETPLFPDTFVRQDRALLTSIHPLVGMVIAVKAGTPFLPSISPEAEKTTDFEAAVFDPAFERELQHSLHQPAPELTFGCGSKLYIFTIPAGIHGFEYIPYADWMAREQDIIQPWRSHLRAALFDASLPDEASGLPLPPPPIDLVSVKLREEALLTVASLESTLEALRPVVDDTPGHGSPSYAFRNAKALSAFVSWMGDAVRNNRVDRNGELTFISAVASRHDRFLLTFGDSIPEELGLAWGKHERYPSECLYVYSKSSPDTRLDIGADKSLYNAMRSTTGTEVNLRLRSQRAIHECTRPLKSALLAQCPNCFSCGALAGSSPSERLEAHHVTTVADIHNQLVAPSLSEDIFLPSPRHHEFKEGPIKGAVVSHLTRPGSLVPLCSSCHSLETAGRNRSYVAPETASASASDTMPATAWWVVQALAAKYGIGDVPLPPAESRSRDLASPPEVGWNLSFSGAIMATVIAMVTAALCSSSWPLDVAGSPPPSPPPSPPGSTAGSDDEDAGDPPLLSGVAPADPSPAPVPAPFPAPPSTTPAPAPADPPAGTPGTTTGSSPPPPVTPSVYVPYSPAPDLTTVANDALRVMLLSAYVLELQTELNTLSARRDARLQEKSEKLEESNQLHEKYRQTAEAEIRQVQAAWKTATSKLAEKTQELADTAAAFDDLTKRHRHLADDADAIRDQMARVSADASIRIKSLQDRHELEMTTSVSSALVAANEATSANVKLEFRLGKIVDEKTAAEASVAKLTSEIAILRDKCDALADTSSSDAAHDLTRLELQTTGAALFDVENRLNEQLGKYSDLRLELTRTDVALKELTLERSQLKTDADILRGEIHQLKADAKHAHVLPPAPFDMSQLDEKMANLEARMITRLSSDARFETPRQPRSANSEPTRKASPGGKRGASPSGALPPLPEGREASGDPLRFDLDSPYPWLSEWDPVTAGLDFATAWDSTTEEWRQKLSEALTGVSPTVRELSIKLSPVDSIVLAASDQLLMPEFSAVVNFLSGPVMPIQWFVKRAYQLKRWNVYGLPPAVAAASALDRAKGPPSMASLPGDDDNRSVVSEAAEHDALPPQAQVWLDRMNKPVEEQLEWCRDSPDYAKLSKVVRRRVDDTGRDWYIKACYTPTTMTKWAKAAFGRVKDRDASYRVTDFSPARMKFPIDLANIDPEVIGAAWDGYRRYIITSLQRALAVASDWHEILQQWSLSAEHPIHGNRTIKDRVDEAVADSLLKTCPPLHADFLINLLDTTFGRGSVRYGVEAQVSHWKQCVQRHADEDLVACGRRHLGAYLKFIDDPNVTASNLWLSRNYRTTFNEQLSKSIFNDLGNTERGKHNQYLFEKEVSKLYGKLEAGQITASESSGLIVIENELLHAEQSWTTQRRQSTQTAGAAAPKWGDEDPPSVNGVLPPLDNAVGNRNGRGRGGGGGGKPAPAKGSQYSQEPPPANASMPEPRSRRTQESSNPSGTRRKASAPAGSKGHPWHSIQGTTWASPVGPDDWDHVVVDLTELRHLAKYPAVAPALAQCWPADASMKTVASMDSDQLFIMKPDAGWPLGHCKFCLYRPHAKSNTPEDQMWFYGTGDGAHDAVRCFAFKRFIAEGGDATQYPSQAAHIGEALRFVGAYNTRHGPK